MKQLLFIIAAALLAAGTCNRINARNMEKPKKISVFPVGDKLPETFSKYFVGQAYLARLTRNGALNCPISNVTFEPGCRNNWHSHTGGQILVAVGGRGYYQAEGCCRATWSRSLPTRCTGTARLLTVGSRIWRSKPIRRSTAIRGSDRWTTRTIPL